MGRLVKETLYNSPTATFGADTLYMEYFYNSDNTLDYSMEHFTCNGGDCRHVSKFHYRFDSLTQMGTIAGIFYEKCSDYPLKKITTFNNRGQILEERIWEVPGGIPDSTCFSYNAVRNYDPFDTSWKSDYHKLVHRYVFNYSKRRKLVGVTEVFSPEAGYNPVWDKEHYFTYMVDFSCDGYLDLEEAYPFTIMPYLASMGMPVKKNLYKK